MKSMLQFEGVAKRIEDIFQVKQFDNLMLFLTQECHMKYT